LHHIPNLISIIRAILVLPIAILLIKEAWVEAFVLILIAGSSDALDGYLAKTYNWQSRLGSILDPLADKLLIVIIFITLANKGIIPLWLAIIVIGRDVIILVGATLYQWLTKDLEIAPLFSSKVNTALQILFVLGLMVHLAITPLSDSLLKGGQYAVAALAIYSGVSYVVCWAGYYMNYLRNAK